MGSGHFGKCEDGRQWGHAQLGNVGESGRAEAAAVEGEDGWDEDRMESRRLA